MSTPESISKLLMLQEGAASMVSVALTHESVLATRTNSAIATWLFPPMQTLGRSAVDAILIEYCLVDNGYSDQALVNIDLPQFTKRAVDGLISRFDLLSAVQVGRSIALSTLALRQPFRSNLVFRFLGAVLMSSSFDFVKSLVRTEIASCENTSQDILEPKSCLQEITQRLFKVSPTYAPLEVSGPDHDKLFVCRVSISNRLSAEGSGSTILSAHKDAAAAVIRKGKLGIKAPDIVEKYSRHRIAKAQGMTSSSLQPAPMALQLARKLKPVLDCSFIDDGHLAVALTLSNRHAAEKYDTHFRHKMLGSAFESVAFQIYAWHTIQKEIISSQVAEWVRFEATVRSPLNYARLYDTLNLNKYVYRHETGILSADREADVLKAISGAAYLSVREFKTLYEWMDNKIGKWLSSYLSDLISHPWKVVEPKSTLQEMIQASKSFEIEYVDTETGPAHERSFCSVVACGRIGDHSKTYLGKGQASLKGEAQKRAAQNSILCLMPTDKSAARSKIASAIWQACFDNAAAHRGVLPQIGLPLHLRMFKCVRAYSELKALLSSFPDLLPSLSAPECLDAIARSAKQANPFPLDRILKASLEQIDLWTSISPENTDRFISQEAVHWLGRFRSVSNWLKLPESPVSWPMSESDPGLMLKLIHFKQLQIRLGKTGTVPNAMLAHMATLLELLDEHQTEATNISILFEAREDFHVCVIAIALRQLSQLQCADLICGVDVQAFFLGTEVALRQTGENLLISLKTVFPQQENTITKAFFLILRKMYDEVREVQSLYRVIHDLKNEMITLQNYARLAIADPRSKYDSLATINRIQQDLLSRKHALAGLFHAIEEDSNNSCDLYKTFQEFASRDLYTLADNIQLRLDTTIEAGGVKVSREHILSILSNLTRNAVEAMPGGGVLSVTAIYFRQDGQCLIQISDTGIGIPPEKLDGLFTSLRSTKRGMGLGLATVNHVVSQYKGKVEVESQLMQGTKITVVLSLDAAPDVI